MNVPKRVLGMNRSKLGTEISTAREVAIVGPGPKLRRMRLKIGVCKYFEFV